MDFASNTAVHNVAVELKELQWNRFMDATGIRADVESGNMAALQLRQSWELANPVSKYYSAAVIKLNNYEAISGNAGQ